MRFFFTIFALCISIGLQVNISHAHSGRTNSDGCHHNLNTGRYHCHNEGEGNATDSGVAVVESQSSSGTTVNDPGPPEIVSVLGKMTVGERLECRVMDVVDGDTFKCLVDEVEISIRLYGVDAPESGQAYGGEARETLSRLLLGRKIVAAIVDNSKYGLPVALVHANNINVNETLVRSGAAWVYEQYCQEDHCTGWRLYQKQAQARRKLLWRDEDPVPPWEWRKKNR